MNTYDYVKKCVKFVLGIPLVDSQSRVFEWGF